MRRGQYGWTPFAVVVVGLLSTTQCFAQGGAAAADSVAGASDAQVAELRAEVAALRNRLDQSLACSDGAGGCCRPAEGHCGWEAGYSFLFAKPYYKESFEATSMSLASGTFSLIPFGFDYQSTPQAWLGYVGQNGFGVRSTYWQYDHAANPLTLVSDAATINSAHSTTVIFPATISTTGPGQVLSIDSRLRVQTLDLEGTQRSRVGDITAVGSAGLRYSALDQRFSAAVIDAGTVTQQLAWSRRFEGLGPTVGLEATKPLHVGRLSAIVAGRGALLFGQKNLTRFVQPASLTAPPLIRFENADEVVGCGSLEVGAQWERSWGNGSRLFVRGTYGSQLWTDAGAPTLTFLGVESFNLSAGLDF